MVRLPGLTGEPFRFRLSRLPHRPPLLSQNVDVDNVRHTLHHIWDNADRIVATIIAFLRPLYVAPGGISSIDLSARMLT